MVSLAITLTRGFVVPLAPCHGTISQATVCPIPGCWVLWSSKAVATVLGSAAPYFGLNQPWNGPVLAPAVPLGTHRTQFAPAGTICQQVKETGRRDVQSLLQTAALHIFAVVRCPWLHVSIRAHKCPVVDSTVTKALGAACQSAFTPSGFAPSAATRSTTNQNEDWLLPPAATLRCTSPRVWLSVPLPDLPRQLRSNSTLPTPVLCF